MGQLSNSNWWPVGPFHLISASPPLGSFEFYPLRKEDQSADTIPPSEFYQKIKGADTVAPRKQPLKLPLPLRFPRSLINRGRGCGYKMEWPIAEALTNYLAIFYNDCSVRSAMSFGWSFVNEFDCSTHKSFLFFLIRCVRGHCRTLSGVTKNSVRIHNNMYTKSQ